MYVPIYGWEGLFFSCGRQKGPSFSFKYILFFLFVLGMGLLAYNYKPWQQRVLLGHLYAATL